ncbi:substrate-binding domain-containing protein [Micromonospora sp. M12]
MEIKVRQIGPFSPTIQGGERAAQELCARPATAVLAFNDQMAIGLIRGFGRMGVDVPGDVSIVGFDNILAADLVTPGLTTVAAPLYAEGSAATRHLLTMIAGRRAHRPTDGPAGPPRRPGLDGRPQPAPRRARPSWERQRPAPNPTAHLS